MDDFISLNQAAKCVSKSYNTISKLVKNGKIPSRKNERGHAQVQRSTLLNYFSEIEMQHGFHERKEASIENSSEFQLISILKTQNERLETLLQEERSEKRELRIQVRELQDEILKLVAEIRALLKDDKQGWQLPFRWKRG